MRNQKPRVLFVMPNLTSGGAEKSLVTLLQVLGERHGAGRDFDVDLFLFEKQGLFLPQLPPWVRVISCGRRYSAFTGSWRKALPYFLLHGRPDILIARYRYAKAWAAPAEERDALVWRSFAHALPRQRKRYAAAIAYLEGNATYYCAEKIRAARKITFFHNDCRNFLAQRALDERHFPAFDLIISVSESCCDALREAFPALANRVRCVKNIIAPGLLKQLAVAEPPPWEPAPTPTLLTIGRLTEQKGIDLAIRACGILKRAGVPLRWFVIGKGELEAPLRAMLQEEDLEDSFILLGERANPYPALAACDVYVQPSRYEGKSIALEEAKAMQKPIVTTRFGTVANQITEGVTGVIAEMDAQRLADAICRLLGDSALQVALRENLLHTPGNEAEAQKFMDLLQLDGEEA
ncbi:MAG: glycosyltransferase [Oscillospiraceae bacterium]|jgi:glycosyltransferase involved in cell wall biosynthesis|nr:glycosyltransferase [Oscillospiraceae bacterium]